MYNFLIVVYYLAEYGPSLVYSVLSFHLNRVPLLALSVDYEDGLLLASSVHCEDGLCSPSVGAKSRV